MARIPLRGDQIEPGRAPVARPPAATLDAIGRAGGGSLAQARLMEYAAASMDRVEAANRRAAAAGMEFSEALGYASGQMQYAEARQENLDQQMEAARRRSEVNKAQAMAWGQLEEAADEIGEKSDPAEAPESFGRAAGSILEEYRKTMDEKTFAEFEPGFAVRTTQKSIDIKRLSRRRTLDVIRADTSAALQQWQVAAAEAPTPADRKQAIDSGLGAIESARRSGALGAADAEKIRSSWLVSVDDVAARRVLAQDPRAGLAALEGGGFPYIEPDRRQTLVEHATRLIEASDRDAMRAEDDRKRAIVADANEAMRWEYADLMAGISESKVGEAEVEKFRAKWGGYITETGRPLAAGPVMTMQSAIERRDRDARGEAAEVNRVQTLVSASDVQAGALKQRDADLYFAKILKPRVEQSPEETMPAIVGFARQTGLVPSQVKEAVAKSQQSGMPTDVRMEYARLVDRIRIDAPMAYDQIPRDARLAATMLVEYGRISGDPDAAAARVDAVLQVPEAERKRRASDVTDRHLSAQSDKLRKDLSGWFDDYGLDTGPISRTVNGAFSRVYRDAYVLTGDASVAYDEARATVEREFGPTEVDGAGGRFVFMPPERVHGVAGLSESENAKWQSEQLQSDIKAVPGINPEEVDRRGVYLVSELSTRDDGAYSVVWRDTLVPIFSQDGGEMRWRPDWQTSAARTRREAASDEAIAAARAERENRIGVMQRLEDTLSSPSVPLMAPGN